MSDYTLNCLYSVTFVSAFVGNIRNLKINLSQQVAIKGGLRKDSKAEVWKLLSVVLPGKARTKDTGSLERNEGKY